MLYPANEIYKNLDKFNEIWVKRKLVNPIPPDVKITIYVQSEIGNGFLVDVYKSDLKTEPLVIPKSWILQEELDKLILNYEFNS
jgi:hypothetical protein